MSIIDKAAALFRSRTEIATMRAEIDAVPVYASDLGPANGPHTGNMVGYTQSNNINIQQLHSALWGAQQAGHKRFAVERVERDSDDSVMLVVYGEGLGEACKVLVTPEVLKAITQVMLRTKESVHVGQTLPEPPVDHTKALRAQAVAQGQYASGMYGSMLNSATQSQFGAMFGAMFDK